MEIRIRITKLIAALLSLDTLLAENSVLLKVGFQKITSSTLKWLPANGPASFQDAVVGSVDYIPVGAGAGAAGAGVGAGAGFGESDSSGMEMREVWQPQSQSQWQSQAKEVNTFNVYICRARVNGNWVPGSLSLSPSPSPDNSTSSRQCTVSLFEKVIRSDQYEVLHNVEHAARLVWKDWGRVEVPQKAVSAGQYYVAHAANKNLKIYSEKLAVGRTYWIGKIDPREGVFGRMSVVNEKEQVVNDIEEGRVLVEMEPVLYELTITKLTTAREKVISRTVLKLGEVTLRNDLHSPMKVESVITFQWRYNSSWGTVKAMLRGLNTTIFLPDTSQDEKVKWGIQKEEIRDGIQSVEADLEPGTAVQVTLQANLYEVEVPYTGSLLSVFDDSHTMNRTVQGVWLRSALVDIEPVYGPMYYLHNNSLVPATTTTSTTTTTTSSTSTSTSTEITSTISKIPKIDSDSAGLTTTGIGVSGNGSGNGNGNGNGSSSLPARDDNVMNDGRDAMLLGKKNKSDKEGSASILIVSYSCLISSMLITTGRHTLIA